MDEMCTRFSDRLISYFSNTCPIKTKLKPKSKSNEKKTKGFTIKLAQVMDMVIVLRDRLCLGPEHKKCVQEQLFLQTNI